MKRIFQGAALLLALCLLFLLLEYAAGLVPQEWVRANVVASLDQLADTRENRLPLNPGDASYQISGFSEALMLDLCLYMNTREDPASVLENPLLWHGAPVDSLAEAAASQSLPAADAHYVRYFAGFRAVLRPLLSVSNYPQIRRLSMWVMTLLFFSAAYVLAQRAGRLPAVAFVCCYLSLNPVAISHGLVYAFCFAVAFLGMIIAPRFLSDGRGPLAGRFPAPFLFLALGALTQYLDFYTVPIVTYAFPAIALLLSAQKEGKLLRFRESGRMLLLLFAGWSAGYLGVWLFKLAATSVFTPYDALFDGVATLLERLGVIRNPELVYDGCLPAAFRYCFEVLLSKELALCCVVAGVYWIVGVIRTRARSLRPALIYLVLALLPLVWILVSAQAAAAHSHFQFRTLGAFLFALCGFVLTSVNGTAPAAPAADKKLPAPPEDA